MQTQKPVLDCRACGDPIPEHIAFITVDLCIECYAESELELGPYFFECMRML